MKPPTPSQVPGLLDQVRLDLAHNLGTIRPHGREPTDRIGLALTIAGDTTYGPASANLDPTTSGTGSDVTLTPTESAAARRQGRELRDELCAAVADLEAASARLRLLVVHYVAPIEAQAANARRPITDTDDCCELHAKIGVYAPPRPARTKVDGRAYRLCGPCESRYGRAGRLPTRADLEYHETHGGWPKVHEQAA